MALERSIQQLKVPVLYGSEIAVNLISLSLCCSSQNLSSHLGPNKRNHKPEGVVSSNKKDTSEYQLHTCFVILLIHIFFI